MTIDNLKQLAHVKVSENENGTVTVTTDDGYCLASTHMQEKVQMDGMDGMEGTENAEKEMEEVTDYADTIYCRKDTILPDYSIILESDKPTDEPLE